MKELIATETIESAAKYILVEWLCMKRANGFYWFYPIALLNLRRRSCLITSRKFLLPMILYTALVITLRTTSDGFSDSGINILSHFFTEVWRIICIQDFSTKMYHSISNEQVERSNSTILSALRHHIGYQSISLYLLEKKPK